MCIFQIVINTYISHRTLSIYYFKSISGNFKIESSFYTSFNYPMLKISRGKLPPESTVMKQPSRRIIFNKIFFSNLIIKQP